MWVHFLCAARDQSDKLSQTKSSYLGLLALRLCSEQPGPQSRSDYVNNLLGFLRFVHDDRSTTLIIMSNSFCKYYGDNDAMLRSV